MASLDPATATAFTGGVALLLLAGSGLSCAGGGEDETALPPLGLAASTRIEGAVQFTQLPPAQRTYLQFVDTMGTGSATSKGTWLTWSMVNDDRHLYIGLEWFDDTHDAGFDPRLGPVDFDGVKLFIDGDGDGLFEENEDSRTLVAASVGSLYLDQHASLIQEADRVADGSGKLAWDAALGRYQAELIFPLESDPAGQDADLTDASRYGILLYDHVEPYAGTGNVASLFAIGGIGTSTWSWNTVALEEAEPHRHPELPTDLEGLIVFLSDQDTTQPEVYAFDPATGVTRQVTNEPGLYKENVSLSHDRTQVAFHGGPDRADLDGYEIYRVGIDGTGLTRLTWNTWLDGHPAWSPDDQRFAYASQRDGRFSIHVMDVHGTPIADLTPPAWEDNDPEYLPDGRIVFKTDRFSTPPLKRIAVMDEDGSDLRQLSRAKWGSDHDPTGSGGHVWFQRFPKNTFYADDPEAPFVAWDLYRVALSGGAERVVLADGWVNWLPIVDPSGRYLLYLKSQGYTAAHLATLDGQDLGRLIPDRTRILYVDWK